MGYVVIEQFKDAIGKRRLKILLMLSALITLISAVLGLFSHNLLLNIVIGAIGGFLGSYYVRYDLKRFKAELLKSEIHDRIITKYGKSDKVDYLYYSNDLHSDIRGNVEDYANKVLKQFEGIILKSDLKVVVVTNPLDGVVNSLFERLGKAFEMDESVTGMYLVDVDCILIHYFGLPIENCIGHEFVHFLMAKSKSKLIEDKVYEEYFTVEKDMIFPLEYQSYYRGNIKEFTAELGANIINGNKELLNYQSGLMLSEYLEKFIWRNLS